MTCNKSRKSNKKCPKLVSRNDATSTRAALTPFCIMRARACCATGQDTAVKENGAAIDNVFGFRWPLPSPSRFALLWTTKVTSFHSCVSFSFLIPLQTTTSRASTKLKCVSIQLPNLRFYPTPQPLCLSLPPPSPPLPSILPQLLTHPPESFSSQVHQLMTAAFTDPIPAAKPLGFRFTVGGGKKVGSAHYSCSLFSVGSPSYPHSGACKVR
jgi:hypothetical protein